MWRSSASIDRPWRAARTRSSSFSAGSTVRMVSVVIRFQIHAASYADIVGNACVNRKCEPTRLTGHGVAQFFLEAFQWHGVKRGDAFAFYAGDIRVEGPATVPGRAAATVGERAYPYGACTPTA